MKFKEIELLAAKKEPLPYYATLEEMMCYTCMKGLYSDFHNKRIDAQEATKQKKAVQTEFERNQREHRLQVAAYVQYQNSIQKAGMLRAEVLHGLKKSVPYSELLVIAAECIGAMCADSAFAKIVRDGIKRMEVA